MEHNTTHNDFDKKVFEKIDSGEVKMRPKTFFVCKVVLLIVVAFLVLATSAILVSFMIFSLRVSGRLFLLGFGGRGLLAFFITFPWFILIADILFIVLFERLLNHFKLGYRLPLLYTLGASAVIIILAGLILDHISFHETLAHEAMEHHLGPVGGMYADVRLPPREVGVFRGIVATSTFSAFGTGTSTMAATSTVFINSFNMIRDDEDPNTNNATDTATIWHVILPPGVSIAGFLTPGDIVLVAGDVSSTSVANASGTIRAYGIRKIGAGDEE